MCVCACVCMCVRAERKNEAERQKGAAHAGRQHTDTDARRARTHSHTHAHAKTLTNLEPVLAALRRLVCGESVCLTSALGITVVTTNGLAVTWWDSGWTKHFDHQPFTPSAAPR